MPGNPLTDPNWASDVADTVERVVGTVRDRTTSNLVIAARGLVFGLLGGLIGIAVLALAVIALTRALQSLFELGTTWPRAVYLSYFVVGGICCLAGLLMMRKRRPSDA